MCVWGHYICDLQAAGWCVDFKFPVCRQQITTKPYAVQTYSFCVHRVKFVEMIDLCRLCVVDCLQLRHSTIAWTRQHRRRAGLAWWMLVAVCNQILKVHYSQWQLMCQLQPHNSSSLNRLRLMHHMTPVQALLSPQMPPTHCSAVSCEFLNVIIVPLSSVHCK